RRSRLAEQLADQSLGPVVLALAEVLVADVAALVDQVLGRPVLVFVGVPRRVVRVERDRPADAELLRRRADVVRDGLEPELRCVDADDLEPRLPIVAPPRL